MQRARRTIFNWLAGLCLVLGVAGCGGSPWRFDSGTPAIPSGVVAAAGDGKVSLSWGATQGAAGYNVYYSSAPGLAAGGGTRAAQVTGTSAVVPGLQNGTRYYFAVTAYNTKSESAVSAEVSSVPAPQGPFSQADLEGTWRFNALVSGAAPRWMRGKIGISALGAVSVTFFEDSLGGGAAPADLFTALALQPDGTVLQSGAAAAFHGVLAANLHKDLLAGTTTLADGSRVLVVLQKSVPGVTFSAADVKGTGRLVAGPLLYVYHQLSLGTVPEWEYASCQVGQDQGVSYASLTGPTPRPLPGGGAKVVSLSITADGVVSETPYAGVLPQPAALVTQGVMSADKMTVVATATDATGAPLLRIMQLVHPPAVLLTSSSYQLNDLAGSYGFHALYGAASPGWGYGEEIVDASGGLSFGAFRDAVGGTALPAPYTLAMDQQGGVTAAAQPSYNGQFSYGKEMAVTTGNAAAGVPFLGIALRRN